MSNHMVQSIYARGCQTFLAQVTPVNNFLIHGTPELHCHFIAPFVILTGRKYVNLSPQRYSMSRGKLERVFCFHYLGTD